MRLFMTLAMTLALGLFVLPVNAETSQVDEIQQFSQDCREGKMHLYYDCSCLKDEYIEHREKLGQNASPSSIRSKLGANCKDGDGIAAQMNEKCLKQPAYLPKGHDPETFCSCYSRNFKSLFERWDGVMQPTLEVQFKSAARLKCQDPEAYKKVYGDRFGQ